MSFAELRFRTPGKLTPTMSYAELRLISSQSPSTGLGHLSVFKKKLFNLSYLIYQIRNSNSPLVFLP